MEFGTFYCPKASWVITLILSEYIIHQLSWYNNLSTWLSWNSFSYNPIFLCFQVRIAPEGISAIFRRLWWCGTITLQRLLRMEVMRNGLKGIGGFHFISILFPATCPIFLSSFYSCWPAATHAYNQTMSSKRYSYEWTDFVDIGRLLKHHYFSYTCLALKFPRKLSFILHITIWENWLVTYLQTLKSLAEDLIPQAFPCLLKD